MIRRILNRILRRRRSKQCEIAGLALAVERYMSDYYWDHEIAYERFQAMPVATYIAHQLHHYDWIK